MIVLVRMYTCACVCKQLLHVGLKRGKFNLSSEEQLGMLDPFVPLLAKSLSSPNIKVLSRTLQCLVWIIRMPLPSLANHIDEISHHLFGLLRRYARAGSAVGSNRELVHSAFKVYYSNIADVAIDGNDVMMMSYYYSLFLFFRP